MKRKLVLFLGACFALTFLIAIQETQAECPSLEGLESRAALLARRIDQGQSTGKLTEAQCEKLKRRLAKIQQGINTCKALRRVSLCESRRIDDDFHSLSMQISRALKSSKSRLTASSP